MYTTSAMANPPHASAVPVTTSKAIHKPSGYPSLSAVVAPSPSTRRQAINSTPRPNSPASARVAGVTSGPPTGSARILVVLRGMLPIAPQHQTEQAVQCDRCREVFVDRVLD